MKFVGKLVESFRDLVGLGRSVMYFKEMEIPADVLEQIKPKTLEIFSEYLTLFDFYPAPDHKVTGKCL